MAVELARPAQMALRDAVDEQDRAARRIAGFIGGELHPAAAGYVFAIHVLLPGKQRDP